MATDEMVGVIPAKVEEKITRFQEAVEAVCNYEGRGKGWQDVLLTRTGASFALSHAIHEALTEAANPAPARVCVDQESLIKWLDAEIAPFTELVPVTETPEIPEIPELSSYERGYRAAMRHTRTRILAPSTPEGDVSDEAG